MLEKLNEIDISAVKKLVKIKKEQDQLRAYLTKAESLKGKANDVVYAKVMEDYRSRHETLERTAVPLKVEAHQEYQKLSNVLFELKEAFEGASLDKEELELRHAIGELSDKELSEKDKEAKSLVETRRAELAAGEQLKSKFVEAFHSEEELEGFRDADEFDEDLTHVGAAPKTPPLPAKDETLIQPIKPINGDASADDTGKNGKNGSDASDDDGVDSTFIVPEATLTTEENGRPVTQFQLGALSYIGRANDNQIQIKAAGVSRKHAVVTAGPEGFIIRDLDSQNGTWVNQARVSECVLTDGDRVRIGHVQLIFSVPPVP